MKRIFIKIISIIMYYLKLYQLLYWLYPIFKRRYLLQVITFHRVIPREKTKNFAANYDIGQDNKLYENILNELNSYFEFIDLSTYIKFITGKEKPKKHSILITFDDADSEFMNYALPILKKNKWSAVIFTPTGCIDSDDHFWHLRLSNIMYRMDEIKWQIIIDNKSEFPQKVQDIINKYPSYNSSIYSLICKSLLTCLDKMQYFDILTVIDMLEDTTGKEYTLGIECLSWNELIKLDKLGIDIESHTVTHRKLEYLNEEDILSELTQSKSDIKSKLNKISKAFCYPSGSYNDKVAALTKQSGYEVAFTSESKTSSYPLKGLDLYKILRPNIGGDNKYEINLSISRLIFKRIMRLPSSEKNNEIIKKTPKQRLVKNIFSSWSATFITAVISLFMSPFLVHTLGKEQYGIWALVLSIVSYTSLLNAGMNQTLTRFVPKYYAKEDYNNLNQVINSVLLIFCISGVLVLIISVLIAYFFIDFFNIDNQYLEIARNVLLLVGLNQALIFFYIAPSACGPFHRWTITNSIGIARTIIGSLLTVYFLKSGYGLLALAIITVSVTLLGLQIQTIIRNRIVPQIKYSFKFITKPRLIEMLNYGGISFLIVATYLIIFSTDNIIIGIFQTTTAVTFYSIAGSLIGFFRVIANAVCTPLTPLISHMDSTSNFEEIKNLYYNISKKLYYIYAALCVSILMFGEKFIFLWMGKDFGSTSTVLMILIIPACLYLPQVPANSVLLGIGKHKQLFYILAAEAVSNIVLSIILVQKWGIYGVAWGTAIPQLAIYSFVYPWFFNKTISGNLKLFYTQLLKMLFYGVLFALPISLFLIKFNEILSWIDFMTNTFIVLLFILIGFYLIVLDHEEKIKIQSMIKKLRKNN